jgi:cyclic pyranopterin phosphate synthase
LREGRTDDEIGAALRGLWSVRNDRYSEIRSAETIHLQKVEMSRIGG